MSLIKSDLKVKLMLLIVTDCEVKICFNLFQFSVELKAQFLPVVFATKTCLYVCLSVLLTLFLCLTYNDESAN